MSSFVMLTLVVCMSAAVAFTTGDASVPQCPEGWAYEPTAQRCYWFVRSLSTWNDALETCEEVNATLARVPNKDVGRALLAFVTGQMDVVDINGFHIGLRFNSTEGKWLWTADGSEMNMTNDYIEEPLPAHPKEQQCVEVSLDTFNWGRWIPVVCEGTYGQALKPAVCERPTDQQLKDAKAAKEKTGESPIGGKKGRRGGRGKNSGAKYSATVAVKTK
ncbi:C-type lectin domain family 7 member A isoform 1 [Aphelenchoides avenae]|nr:C-type lectin domain family 7 member A isoform 1 [Aphelenchus avenae]